MAVENGLKNVFAGAVDVFDSQPGLHGQTAHTLQQTREALGLTKKPVPVNTTDQMSLSKTGQVPDITTNQQKINGQSAEVEYQKGAYLQQVQDVKQQIASTFVDVAKDRGYDVGDAKSAIAVARPTTMIDAATQVATAGGGPLMQAVTLYHELRGSLKGMTKAEAESIMEEVKTKLQTAKHDSHFGFETTAGTKGPDIDLEDLTAEDLLTFMETPEEEFTKEFDAALEQLDLADTQILAVEEFYNSVIAAAIENNDTETLAAIGAEHELTSFEVEALVSLEIIGAAASEPLIPTPEVTLALNADPMPVPEFDPTRRMAFGAVA